VYNIQKAVSRLNFAPKLKEIEVTDIKAGIAVFKPKPDKPVSYAALKAVLKKAGYELASSEITVAGTLARDDARWWVVAESSGQRFALEGASVDQALDEMSAGERVEISGGWKTAGEGTKTLEVISPRTVKKDALKGHDTSATHSFVLAGFGASAAVSPAEILKALAPIRTTSPGLTVYRGGAVTPRLFLVKQHLGDLNVSRQTFQLSVSYTPTPRLQLEAEIPFSRLTFDDGVTSGSGEGFGNLTLWGKYRFYRRVETWGDRQAAFRFGLELPTGKKSAPSERQVRAPAFVRQQLTPISGGLSAHLDAAYSQARGRFIFGGNVEGSFRSARDGFRLGHELRINTDLEYVLLPLKYRRPTKELFILLETNYVDRGLGRVAGTAVRGSSSREYFLSPGLQYVATSRLVFEASVQIPLVRETGPQVLRTDHNILIGARYLF